MATQDHRDLDCGGEMLESLTLKKYRGYESPQTIKFAHPNGKVGSGLTLICGSNNSGKSSLFHALKKFHDETPDPRRYMRQPTLERDEKHVNGETLLTLASCDGETGSIWYKKENIMPLESSEALGIAYLYEFVSSSTAWKAEGNRLIGRNEHQQKYGILTSIDSFDQYTGIFDNEFGNFLIAIRDDPKRKRKFNQFLKKVIPNYRDWYVRNITRDKWRVVVSSRDKQVHSSKLLGSGMQRLFRIASTLCAPEYPKGIVIDEPELYLHPQAQKRLIEALADHAKQNQVILITHSPHFVRWQDIRNGANVAHTTWDEHKKENVIVDLTAGTPEVASIMNFGKNDWEKPYLIDTVTKELFFTDKILIVEGQEDVSLLTRLCIETDTRLNFDFFGYGAGTAQNIRNIAKLSIKLGVKTCVLYDGDQDREYTRLVAEHGSEAMILKFTKDDIRDKGRPGDRKYKEGYFQNGIIKTRKDQKYLLNVLSQFNRY